MCTVYHVPTNVRPWGPCPTLQAIDSTYLATGSKPLALDAGAYALEADGDHYTVAAYERFARDLVALLPRRGRVLIMTDSTVDFHNWENDTHTGWASEVLQALRPDTVVDSVCGSGFVARARVGEHFYARLRERWKQGEEYSAVVFIGGWNDARDVHAAHTTLAMQRALRICFV